jgi:Terminase large subunit, T4likevirus-type, N-terminal
MPFAAKQNDWRKLPVEVRETLLRALQDRAAAVTGGYLSAVELAHKCGLVPDPWQKDLLESADRQMILNCSRQSGKSTVSALLALHQTVYVPDSLSLVLAPTQRQAMETYRKVHEGYALLTEAPGVTRESSLKLELANGSRCQVLPGREENVRGFSNVALLIVDEAARVKPELYNAIRPMLAVSGGRIILLSTPFGARGFFWEEWSEGGPDWKRVRISADQCPRISPSWLEKEKSRIGSWWFDQEYLCQFTDPIDSCFDSADILAAFSPEVEMLWA